MVSETRIPLLSKMDTEEVPLIRFYSAAPRPYMWTSKRGLPETRLQPVDSYMAPIMEWASVAQWKQGGHFRGKRIHLLSAKQIRKLEEEAEDFFYDEFPKAFEPKKTYSGNQDTKKSLKRKGMTGKKDLNLKSIKKLVYF